MFPQLLPNETVPTTRKADESADRTSVVVRILLFGMQRRYLNRPTGRAEPCRLAVRCRAATPAGRGRCYSRPRVRDG